MVRSKALLFSWKKITFFFEKNNMLLKMHWLFKKHRKKLWCSFFWGQNDPEKFFGFSKKSPKNQKKCVFFEKKLMVSDPFCQNVALSFIMQKCEKNVWKKMSKKTIFIFWNFFLKMKIGHFFLSIFEIKKKFLKTKKPSIFSISLKIL